VAQFAVACELLLNNNMTDKRKDQIITALKAGNYIYRYWTNTSTGYLRHQLKGISKLRESEVKELKSLLEVVRVNQTWKPLKLKEME